MPGSAQPLSGNASHFQGFAVRFGDVSPVPQPDSRKQRLPACNNRHAGANGMTKTLIGFGLAIGMGWSAYFAAPAVTFAAFMLAQGQTPDFSAREWTSLTGFGVFAGAMYYLHRQTLADFRADMKDERESRGKLADAVRENTTVTQEYTHTARELINVLRNKAGI